MNNLHRELAPISDAAWAQIEEEASRTLKRYLAGRRVVDVHAPGGIALSAVGTGHLAHRGARRRDRRPPARRQATGRTACPVRTGSPADRRRGAWRERFGLAAGEGCRAAASPSPRTARSSTATRPPASTGIRQGTSNPIMTLPADVRDYPDAIAQALSQLRLVGVNGPYSVVLGADAYTGLAKPAIMAIRCSSISSVWSTGKSSGHRRLRADLS